MDTLGRHPWRTRLVALWRRRPSLRELVAPQPQRVMRLGAPSRFAAGDYVRVRCEADVKSTLRDGAASGLTWLPRQWECCGGVYRVERQVRSILGDDRRTLIPMSRTVVLTGVTCASQKHPGCGRLCEMYFRDDWLEPASPADDPPSPAIDTTALRYVRVRGEREIEQTLDARGMCDGLTFMPEMRQYAGGRFVLSHRFLSIHELGHDWPVRAPVYVIDGLRCTGSALQDDGPCHRGCALLWHERWLDFEM